jgi:hypothetical protein
VVFAWPCAPAPTDSRRHARGGSAAISASARCSPALVVISVSLHRMASTWNTSRSSSHTRRYFACP